MDLLAIFSSHELLPQSPSSQWEFHYRPVALQANAASLSTTKIQCVIHI